MPKRDESVIATCRWCSKEFHPLVGRPGRYCSKACRSRAALAQVNSGNDTRPSPLPVRPDEAEPAPTPVSVNASRPGHFSAAEWGTAWRESGEYWERVAAWYADRRAAERQRARGRALYEPTLSTEGRILTLAGFGASMFVKHGALHVQSGHTYSTQEPTEEILYRGEHGVSQITWLTNGGAGSLSLEALKWCASQRITVCMLTGRGEHLATITPSPDAPQALGVPAQENGRADAKLRRAQYSLLPSGQDVPLARTIILRKLATQRRCLDRHPELPDRERGYATVDMATEWLSLDPPTPATSSLDGVRLYEARAAQGYFAAWVGLPLRIDAQAARIWSPS